jgi:hypothetical protein
VVYDFRTIPGCKKGTVMDVRGWDYCYYEGTILLLVETGAKIRLRSHCMTIDLMFNIATEGATVDVLALNGGL